MNARPALMAPYGDHDAQPFHPAVGGCAADRAARLPSPERAPRLHAVGAARHGSERSTGGADHGPGSAVLDQSP